MEKVFKLTPKWVKKFAEYKKYPEEVLLKLYNDGVLDAKGVRDYLVKKDFDYTRSITDLTARQAAIVVAKEYHISAAHVLSVYYDNSDVGKKKEMPKCLKCQTSISKYKFNKYYGFCDNCRAESKNVKL